jgi:hypothetical protein
MGGPTAVGGAQKGGMGVHPGMGGMPMGGGTGGYRGVPMGGSSLGSGFRGGGMGMGGFHGGGGGRGGGGGHR